MQGGLISPTGDLEQLEFSIHGNRTTIGSQAVSQYGPNLPLKQP